ncbi:MAG: flagellar protein FlaG [Deltaproteobacteria bacterium]|nr:flagellar protein FlaG [Deltaproteobacteria bacterium]
MKTSQVQITQISNSLERKNLDQNKTDKNSEIKKEEDENLENKEINRAEELKRLEKSHSKPVEEVKKMIEDSIQWKEMRFYRNEKDGKTYVDIVDKNTGEVIRTIPEPDFLTFAKQIQKRAGVTLNISG